MTFANVAMTFRKDNFDSDGVRRCSGPHDGTMALGIESKTAHRKFGVLDEADAWTESSRSDTDRIRSVCTLDRFI